MPIDRYDALVGYLIEDPVLVSSRGGGFRFTARIMPLLPTAGTGAVAETAVRTLVATDLIARRAFEQFTAGDHFLAVGTVHLALCGSGSGCTAGLVFEAASLGHDLSRSRSRYAVDRTRRRRRDESVEPSTRQMAIERELEIAAGPIPPRSARAR